MLLPASSFHDSWPTRGLEIRSSINRKQCSFIISEAAWKPSEYKTQPIVNTWLKPNIFHFVFSTHFGAIRNLDQWRMQQKQRWQQVFIISVAARIFSPLILPHLGYYHISIQSFFKHKVCIFNPLILPHFHTKNGPHLIFIYLGQKKLSKIFLCTKCIIFP